MSNSARDDPLPVLVNALKGACQKDVTSGTMTNSSQHTHISLDEAKNPRHEVDFRR
jgi:hypothetical protein